MYAILATLPIALAIVMMLGFRKKSGISLAAAWALSIVLSVLFWNMEISHALSYTFLGFLSAVNVILIVFSAIFLLNSLIEIRFIETIGNGFNGITQDRRIQILIIAWLFGAFIEGAAGFGTPGALAAPLLVGLGVPVFFAALASLMANYSPVLFGVLGVPPVTGFETIRPTLVEQYGVEMTEQFLHNLTTMTAFSNMFVGSFVPFLIIASIVARDGRKEGLKNAWNIFPLCLFAGVIFTVPVFILSHAGPEIPTLVSSLIAMPIMIFAVKKGFLVPKEVYRFQNDPIKEAAEIKNTGVSLFTAWSPYIIIAALLAVTRLPWLPFRGWINHPNTALSITALFGFEGINWNWPVLNNPGLFPFLPVVLIFLIARKTPGTTIMKITNKTLNQLKNAVVALLFGVALVQIMRFTDYSMLRAAESAAGVGFGQAYAGIGAMTTEIARSLANVFGGAYPLVGPLIGALGAFVSGSHTVSNVMFYSLQLETAALLELPAVLVLIGQTSGASIGNMIAIHNVVSITATTGAHGSESNLIKAAALPFIICSLAISAILFIFLAIGVPWVA